MGVTQLVCLAWFMASKYDDETMIFMLNPCHVTAVSQCLLQIKPNRFVVAPVSDLLFLSFQLLHRVGGPDLLRFQLWRVSFFIKIASF